MPSSVNAFVQSTNKKLIKWQTEHSEIVSDDPLVRLQWEFVNLSEADQSLLGDLKKQNAIIDQTQVLNDFRDIVTYGRDVYSTMVYSVESHSITADTYKIILRAATHTRALYRCDPGKTKPLQCDQSRAKARKFLDVFWKEANEMLTAELSKDDKINMRSRVSQLEDALRAITRGINVSHSKKREQDLEPDKAIQVCQLNPVSFAALEVLLDGMISTDETLLI